MFVCPSVRLSAKLLRTKLQFGPFFWFARCILRVDTARIRPVCTKIYDDKAE